MTMEALAVESQSEEEFFNGSSNSAVSTNSNSLIAELSGKIMQLASPDSHGEWLRFMESLKLLPMLVEKKRKTKAYSYSDYSSRLLVPERDSEHIRRMLCEPDFERIRESVERLSTGEMFRQNPFLFESFLKKLYQEYLEDLDYESMKVGEYPQTKSSNLYLSYSMEQDLMKIRKLERQWVNLLDLCWDIVRPMETHQLFQLIRAAGSSKIKGIRLHYIPITQFFWSNDLAELVKILDEFDIRSLRFGRYDFNKTHIQAKDLNRFVQTVWKSGLRNLDLRSYKLWDFLDPEELIDFVRHAGLSGIKCFGLWENRLDISFSFNDMCRLVREAGESGIRELDLSNNFLRFFTYMEISGLVVLSWESGIRRLDLSSNTLGIRFDGTDKLTDFFIKAAESGIRYLDIWWNNLREDIRRAKKMAQKLCLHVNFQ